MTPSESPVVFARHLHAYLRAAVAARARRVGPFLVALDEHDDGLFRNYAVPDDGAAPGADEVERLVAFFVDRDRVPRLEYLPELAPAVEPALLAAGFVAERRVPVMTCSTAALTAPPAPVGVDVVLAVEDGQLRRVAEAQNEAYGRDVTTEHDVDRLRGTVERGGLVGLALDPSTGRGVGGGLCAPPHEGVSELAAIGVRAPYRRRGVAAALTALLTGACADRGIDAPFLTPAGEAEERVYRSVGYRPVTGMLHVSR